MIESNKKAEGVVVLRFFYKWDFFLVNSPRQNLLSEWESKYLISTLKCKIQITLLLKNNLSEIFYGLKSAYG